jgi:hypothetical protein
MRPYWWIGLILTAISVAFVVADALNRKRKQEEDKLTPHADLPDLKIKYFPISTFLKIQTFILLDRWVVTSHAHSGEHVPQRQEVWRMFRNCLTYLCSAGALVFVATTIAALIAIYCPTSPNVTTWTSIILGIYLVAGAMCIAWSEKQFDSEFAYQYGTMAPLFLAARLRLEPLVAELERLAGDERNRTEFERVRKEARDVLYDLGVEALDENAEWLILHRARPLEPVMAG